MKSRNEEGISAREETRQLIELIRVLARTLGFNNAALSRRAQVPLASLVRYFKGEGEPKLEFLLAVVRALGLEVREFFEIAYPAPAAPTAARRKVEKVLGPVRIGQGLPPPAEPRPEAAPLQREDVERMLDQLRQDVRELIDQGLKRPGAPRRQKGGGG